MKITTSNAWFLSFSLTLCSMAMAQTPALSVNVAQGTNATCQAAPQAVPPMYLRGTMNGWTAQEDFEFVWDCNAFYLNVKLQGEHEFKLADAKWHPPEPCPRAMRPDPLGELAIRTTPVAISVHGHLV
jgi:hypothetical protein